LVPAATAGGASSTRVRDLDKLGQLQKQVFGLADTLRVLTLTANGNAVRSAERQGITLPCVVHRAVWLTGL
jgi:hypothetical protein